MAIFVLASVWVAGLAGAAPKIQLDRTDGHQGKTYVCPDQSSTQNPLWTNLLTVTNTGDATLQVSSSSSYDIGARSFSVLPGRSEVMTLQPRYPELGLHQGEVSISSNDPETPLIKLPISYEGIPQPALVVEDIDGSPFVSGETTFDLGEVFWATPLSMPSVLTRKVSRTIQLRNTGQAIMPVRPNGSMGSYAIKGSAEIMLDDSDLRNLLIMIPPLSTLLVEVNLTPQSLGEIQSRVALSSYWESQRSLRPASFTFDLVAFGKGAGSFSVQSGNVSWNPAGMPPLVFGTQQLTESRDLAVSLMNLGRAPLIVNADVIGDHPDDFIQMSNFPITIPPGGGHNAVVRFSPKDGGPRSGKLRFTTNDPDIPEYDLLLNGEGFRLVLDDPEGADFEQVPIGTLETRTFTLTNKGTTTISGIAVDLTSSAAGQLSVVGDIPYSLPPGGETEFSVRYAPSQPGMRFSNLKVTTLENLNKPLLLSLSAAGTPAASLFLSSERGHVSAPGMTTMKVPYDSVDIGDYKRFAFELKNQGTLPLTLGTEFAPGSHNDFSLLVPLPESIAAGGSTRFEITFRPRDTGNKNAVFRILSNDPDQPVFRISMSGSGFPFEIETPEGTEFENTPVGGNEVLTFVMVNNGSKPLTGITAALLTGEASSSRTSKAARRSEFTLASAIPKSLAPKQRFQFRVNFKPSSAGDRSTRLSLRSSENRKRPIELRLTGKAVNSPKIAVTNPAGRIILPGRSVQNHGKIAVGTTAVREYRITNTGSAPLVISRITFIGSQSSTFSVAGRVAKSVPAGKSVRFKVACRPVTAGPFSKILRIQSNAPDQKIFSFRIHGIGTAAVAAKPKTKTNQPTAHIARTGVPASAEPPPARSETRSITLKNGASFRTITITDPLARGMRPLVEVSSDLVAWQSGARHTVDLISDARLLKVRDATPFNAQTKRHIRVRYIAAP